MYVYVVMDSVYSERWRIWEKLYKLSVTVRTSRMVNIGLSRVDDAVAAKHPVGLLSFIQFLYLLLLLWVTLKCLGWMFWSASFLYIFCAALLWRHLFIITIVSISLTLRVCRATLLVNLTPSWKERGPSYLVSNVSSYNLSISLPSQEKKTGKYTYRKL